MQMFGCTDCLHYYVFSYLSKQLCEEVSLMNLTLLLKCLFTSVEILIAVLYISDISDQEFVFFML